VLRVAYIGLVPMPGEVAAGGVSKVSETFLRECEYTDRDVRIEAITLSRDAKAEFAFRRGNVTYRCLPCKRHGKTLTFHAVEISLLRKRIGALSVDVVHGQPWPEYMVVATSCGIPHLITIHGLPWQEASAVPLVGSERPISLVRELLHLHAIKRADNIISISPYVEKYIRRRTRARIWRIANPIDDRFFHLQPPDQEGLRMICVGTVGKRKNQQLLVKACALLAKAGIKFECRIIGALTSAATAVVELVRYCSLQRQVEVTGKVCEEAVLDHYRWANTVVLPSRGETSPLSLIQGMACGRCLFGARAAGIPSLLHEEKFGHLFSPDDENELCNKLIDFQQRRQLFWRKAAVATEYARSTFRCRTVTNATLDLYQEIAQQPQRRSALPPQFAAPFCG
jgi:glycosyltransferase involved in cell wall biosynthesis